MSGIAGDAPENTNATLRDYGETRGNYDRRLATEIICSERSER
jgi:hypothetical protein